MRVYFLGLNIQGTSWIVYFVIATLGGIICMIAGFFILNLKSTEKVTEEAPTSFQYLATLDKKESQTRASRI